MEWLMMERWSPYLCGAGIGVLSWLTFLFSDKALGTSTTYVKTAGMLERLFRGDRVLQREFFKKTPPAVDWQWMLVLGIVIGAFISAMASGQIHITWVTEPWLTAFGPAVAPRVIVAFAGGALLGLGARWADGCTSGHGISGTMQMAVSSWVAAICFFVGGIAVATLLYAILAG
ncbi:MAG: YeeE/YedE family protein [Dehalococcoidia bacterium]|nr:YeeE/YedE family protein [Dehalococcoidia bacterium]